MKFSPSLLLILSLAFIYSCTIEKRLHTGGYNVSWNKEFQGPNSGNKQNAEAKSTDISTYETDKLILTDVSVDRKESKTSHHPEPSKTESYSEITPTLKKAHTRTVQGVQNEKQQSAQENVVIKKEQKAQIKRERKERTNNARAVALLIEAVIFSLLGLVFIAFFGTFGLIFGIIFYTAAAIMLIASIIYFIL